MKIMVIAMTACIMMAAAPFLYGRETVTWLECVTYAFQNNPDLKSSLEAVNKSKAAVGVARSAYLPQISANAGVSTKKTIDQTPVEKKDELVSYAGILSSRNITASLAEYQYEQSRSKSTITNSITYGVSGKQLIFDSMKTVYDIKAAESAADDALFQFLIKSAQVRFDLRTAFVNLLKAQESVEIAKQIIDIRRKNYNLVKMRYQAGREHKGSLMDAEANLEQAKFNFKESERSILAAQRALLNVMGIYGSMDIRAQGALSEKSSPGNKPNLHEIVKSHPSVLSARKQKELAEYNEKSRISSFLPVISASGSVDQTRSETTGSRPRSTNLQAGLSATMPLFTGGNNYYNLKQAQAQTRKLAADEASARDRVMTNLELYWIGWQNAIDAVEVQKKFLAAAEERARIAEAEYSLGLVVFDIWITIENQLVQTKQSYLEAQAGQLLAEAQWIQAKGETLAYDR